MTKFSLKKTTTFLSVVVIIFSCILISSFTISCKNRTENESNSENIENSTDKDDSSNSESDDTENKVPEVNSDTPEEKPVEKPNVPEKDDSTDDKDKTDSDEQDDSTDPEKNETDNSESKEDDKETPNAPSGSQETTPPADSSNQGAGNGSNSETNSGGETPSTPPTPPAETIPNTSTDASQGFKDAVEVDPSEVEKETEVLEEIMTPAQSVIISPQASGTATASNSYAIVDYSNMTEGYVMVKYTASTTQRLKAQVVGPTTTYTYNLKVGEWTVFPLSDGNGTYQVKVFENTTGNKYAQVLATDLLSVSLKNEFAPFLYSNQYVNYSNANATISTAASITRGTNDMLTKVELVYNYVVANISYDTAKAATVQSGYLPDLDAVLAAKSGICFDYASLMTGMLRSLGIPCKLVVGYAGDVYHAWISVWSQQTGWVDGAVFFDGTTWQRMDPTFASSSGKDPTIMQYIGNGSNYTTKYIY